ncbi:YdbH domain-containing protein [Rheinheimera sp.]|uniref:intermembrane phospholipid transport protein YdbH family protein n=1 Tax=Rheinheimera sp. TaxID=1869214 RepID=UPI00307D8688
MPAEPNRRKANISLGLNLLLLLLVGAVYGGIQLRFYYQQWQPAWSGLTLSWGRLQAGQLNLTLPYAGLHQLQLQQLDIRWSGWPWPLDSVQAEKLSVQSEPVWPKATASPTAQPDASASEPSAAEADAEQALPPLWPLWLPAAVQVNQLDIQLPCAKLDARIRAKTAPVSTPPSAEGGSALPCRLTGSVSLNSTAKQADIRLASSGPLLIEGLGDLEPELTLSLQPEGEGIRLHSLAVRLTSAELAYAGYKLSHSQLALQACGVWRQGQLSLQGTAPLELSTALQQQDLSWKQGQLKLTDWSLQSPWPDWRQASLSARADLTLTQLKHPQLYAQDWHWQAELNGRLAEPVLKGVLKSGSSLVLNHQLKPTQSQYQLSWQLPELFFLAGNPLKLGPAWPELLTVQRGKLSGQGSVLLDRDSYALQSGEQQLQLSGIDAIWDRSELKGLNGSLVLKHSARDWQLSSKALELAQINHGMVAGPVRLAGSYQFMPDKPQAGVLQLNQLQLALFSGQVQVKPGRFDLSQAQQFELELTQLQLADLLQQRPESGVSGRGSISGLIPLRWSAQGVTVEQGQIAALAPGGLLKFDADKAKALAQSNQGMQVLMQALQNFHYSVLSAEVSYATSGQLLLALQLQGKNPDYENGRAIHLTINLEENLPALLASLQLSGQVSELVKKRVQQRLAAKQAKAAKEQQ